MENNNMESKVVVFVIDVDGQKRRTTTENFRDQAQGFMDAFRDHKDDVRDSLAKLSHEYVVYKKGGDNWKAAQEALKDAQKAAAEMNRFLQADFGKFKTVWKPYRVDQAYGLVYRSVSHYWTRFYGTPDVYGVLQYVTFYTDELPKIRYVERDGE